MAVDMNKNAPMSAVKALGDKVKELQVKVDDMATEGGEPNKINLIAVNGTVQTPDSNKQVDITVPTKISELTNDEKFQTEQEVEDAINAKLGAVYKPRGSVAFAELPELSADNVGSVYDISNAFITTEDFIEGAGKSYPAGTNVAIIEPSDGVYKYDVLGGSIDMSDYYTKDEIDEMTATEEEVDEVMEEIFGTT